MAHRSFLRVALAGGLLAVALAALAALATAQQPPAAPAWVTKGAAAFPDLQKKGIFGRGKAWLDEFGSSDEARDEAIVLAEAELADWLYDFAADVVDAYAKAVLKKPLEEGEDLYWYMSCRKRILGVLSASQPPKLAPSRTEKYLDEKEGAWHALVWKDLSFDGFLVMELIAYEFSQELAVLLSVQKIKIDGNKHAALIYGAMEAWAAKRGLSWRPKK